MTTIELQPGIVKKIIVQGEGGVLPTTGE